MGKDVIVACDFSSAQQTFDFLDKFTEENLLLKSVWSFSMPRVRQ